MLGSDTKNMFKAKMRVFSLYELPYADCKRLPYWHYRLLRDKVF